MKRLLHIVGDSTFGGGGVLILDLANAAMGDGFDVAVLTTDPVFLSKLEEQRIPAVEIDVIRRPIRPFWDLGGLIRLWRYLRRERVDVVHTHTSKAGFVGRLAARLAGVPVIVHTVHGFAFHDQSGFAERTTYVGLERLAAYSCDRVITVSEHHRRVAEEHRIGRPGRLMAIPNGLDADRVKPTLEREAIRADLRLPADLVSMVTIGRLADQKGLTYALDAVAALEKEQLPQFRLLLAGDGPLADQLAQQAKDLDIEDVVEFLGFRNDVGNLLSAADIVVMPSLWEGLSISLLEAMAAQKPIITTSIPSNVEVTEDGDCAILVPPKNVVDLTAAMRHLLLDGQARQELGDLASARFESYYTQDRMLDSYLAQYRQLLEAADD